MTDEPTTTEPEAPPEPTVWEVADHKGIESCIQYLGKGKWSCWTEPPVKVGDVLASRTGLYRVTAAARGDEPQVPPVPPQWIITALPGGVR